MNPQDILREPGKLARTSPEEFYARRKGNDRRNLVFSEARVKRCLTINCDAGINALAGDPTARLFYK
jgi:hypothetical protein